MMASAEDERQVFAVINRYATGIDTQDWPLLRTCWADEIDVDYGSRPWTSGDAITEYFAERHAGLRTMHMYGNHTAHDIGPNKVKATTYFRARLLDGDGALFIRSEGWYEDELTKIDGEWKITKRRLHRLDAEGPGSAPMPAR